GLLGIQRLAKARFVEHAADVAARELLGLHYLLYLFVERRRVAGATAAGDGGAHAGSGRRSCRGLQGSRGGLGLFDEHELALTAQLGEVLVVLDGETLEQERAVLPGLVEFGDIHADDEFGDVYLAAHR